MDGALSTLMSRYDRGLITRRQLLQALGVAAVGVPFASAMGQGSCGGANAGTPRCNTTPFPPPFEPTGWKTVLLDHFSLQVVDYQKEAAYFNALMGWKVRSDDGTTAVLDIGDWGAVEIRGGLVVPPAPAAPPPAPPAAAGDTAGGRGGRGGRGGGRGPARAVWDSFCWGIEPWDTRTVEAALTARGLNPLADHRGRAFQSFHVKDPDGFDVQISNGNKRNRRTSPANGKLQAPPPFEPTGWKSLWLDHISFQCTSYKESAAFYGALLGWKLGADEGSQNTTEISPEIGGIIIRGGNAYAPGGLTAGRGGRGGGAGDSAAAGAAPQPLVRRTVINHISFGIADFDAVKVRAELEKRGLNARADTGGRGDILDPATRYKSYHTTTPNGWDLQISNTITREQ